MYLNNRTPFNQTAVNRIPAFIEIKVWSSTSYTHVYHLDLSKHMDKPKYFLDTAIADIQGSTVNNCNYFSINLSQNILKQNFASNLDCFKKRLSVELVLNSIYHKLLLFKKTIINCLATHSFFLPSSIYSQAPLCRSSWDF